jgi:hypothetical protein
MDKNCVLCNLGTEHLNIISMEVIIASVNVKCVVSKSLFSPKCKVALHVTN